MQLAVFWAPVVWVVRHLVSFSARASVAERNGCTGTVAVAGWTNRNPPCALNDFSTCPLPPPQNRLQLRVDAGELKYAGGPTHTS